MNDLKQASSIDIVKSYPVSTIGRVAKYFLIKAFLLLVPVSGGIYLAVGIINYGGVIDQIWRARVDDALQGYFMSTDTAILSEEEKVQLYEKMQTEMEEALGLNEPFLLCSLRRFYQGATLKWGKANSIATRKGDLSVFSSVIKNYCAAFLQMKEAPYIEAAQAYGSSNWRIIFRYLIPRILPLLMPQVIILIPIYVGFEGTLAFLNVSEPNLPTWGKVIFEAVEKGAFQGQLYWVLEPVGLMVLTGLSFAMVGFALDSILNPRLRTR